MHLCGVNNGRGYQKLGQNITKGQPDLHEAIDVPQHLPVVENILKYLTSGSLKTKSCQQGRKIL
jgi:hypothetical protein